MINILVLKQNLKNYLIEVGIYEKLQYSLLHQYFMKIFKPELREYQRKMLNFHKTFLPQHKLVFDIGANIGDKTETYLDLNCPVIAVDPDKKNTKILKRRFRNYSDLTVVDKAISSHEGVETLYSQEPGFPYNTLSEKWKTELEESQESTKNRGNFEFSQAIEVSTTTLDKLIDLYGLPHYIKVDVEGHELDVIRGLHHPISLISFEVNLPEFRKETIELILLLTNLNQNLVFNYVTDDVSGFILEDWVNSNDIINFVEKTPINYIEIFGKSS